MLHPLKISSLPILFLFQQKSLLAIEIFLRSLRVLGLVIIISQYGANDATFFKTSLCKWIKCSVNKEYSLWSRQLSAYRRFLLSAGHRFTQPMMAYGSSILIGRCTSLRHINSEQYY